MENGNLNILIATAVGIVSGVLSAIVSVGKILFGLEHRIEEKEELKRQLAISQQENKCGEKLHQKLEDIDDRIKSIEKAVNGKA